CMRALAAHRQATPMTKSPICADVHQTLDVHLNALAQISLNLTLRFQYSANPTQIVFTEIFYPRIDVDVSLFENRSRTRSTNSINVSKTDLCAFIGRKFYTCDTSHFRETPISASAYASDSCK